MKQEKFKVLLYLKKSSPDKSGKTPMIGRIVSAVLHLDETTPHIHVTLVPIVTGERRKAKDEAEKNTGKKKYKNKNANAPRLCADDVMTRIKLKEYQNTYALAMAKYDLHRGVDGSKAPHTTTQEYYRELFTQKDTIAEKVEYLKQEQEEVRGMTWDSYDRKDKVREKFLAMNDHVVEKRRSFRQWNRNLKRLKTTSIPTVSAAILSWHVNFSRA